MSQRKTADEYRQAGQGRRIEWLGEDEPQNNKTFTTWRCASGHIFESTYNRVARDHGCPICANNIAKTLEDYKLLAAGRGLECLAQEVGNRHAKVSWRCALGHEWSMSYASMLHGNGCPHCSGMATVTAGDYAALAAKRGFIWLGSYPKRAMDDTHWQCGKGHVWKARYNTISNGEGCPECKRQTLANLKTYSPEKYHELAEQHNLAWVGTQVVSTNTKTEWRCANGHTFSSTYQSVRYSSSCPLCLDMVNGAFVSNPQRAIHTMIGGELNYPAGKYRIDVAVTINDISIAIEYDGWHWHQGNDVTVRDAALLAMGYRLLHIRSDEAIPSKEQVDEAIKRLLDGDLSTELILGDWGG